MLAKFEWPTWLLIVFVYGAWLGLLAGYHMLGGALAGAGLVFVLALHGSVQHELIHRHPTRYIWLNTLLAIPPLSLLYPYPVYRDSHIAHHNNENLTLPGIDPESFYVTRAEWERAGAVKRAYYTFNMTILGRLATGPAVSLVHLIKIMFADLRLGTQARKLMWVSHIVAIAAVLWVVSVMFEVPLWYYLLIAYMGNSLSMLRSFYEHRADENPDFRSTINEGCMLSRFLFLNNNYHYLHHKHPHEPWYRLPALYARERESLLQENGQFLVCGYQRWLLESFIKPIDSPIHPFARE